MKVFFNNLFNLLNNKNTNAVTESKTTELVINFQKIPDELICYLFTFSDLKSVVTSIVLVCHLFNKCGKNNIFWASYLINPSGKIYRDVFINQPKLRKPEFLLMDKKGFDYFSENKKTEIQKCITILKTNTPDFKFAGTKSNLTEILSNPDVQKLLQLKILTFKRLNQLGDDKRISLVENIDEDSSFSGCLKKLEKNPQSKALRKNIQIIVNCAILAKKSEDNYAIMYLRG